MHISLLLVTGLAAIATALPQRSASGRDRFRGDESTGQSTQGTVAGVGGNGLSNLPFPQDGAQPPVAIPGDTSAGVGQIVGDEGNLGNKGNKGNKGSAHIQPGLNSQIPGNANQHSNSTGVGGHSPSGPQNGQNAQDEDGQNQSGAAQPTGAFDPALVPEFGVQANVQPDGQGNCLGLGNVKIPCSCPPNRQDFLQKVQAAVAAGNSAGVPVKFPLDGSSASKKARIQTSIVVLQNLNGRGVGCPAAATTFLAQQAAA